MNETKHKFQPEDTVRFKGKKHKVISVWWDNEAWRYEIKQIQGRGLAAMGWSVSENILKEATK